MKLAGTPKSAAVDPSVSVAGNITWVNDPAALSIATVGLANGKSVVVVTSVVVWVNALIAIEPVVKIGAACATPVAHANSAAAVRLIEALFISLTLADSLVRLG